MVRGRGGSFRGNAGSRGRGQGRGRGRGQGRGGRAGAGRGRGRGGPTKTFDRYGPNKRFDTERIADDEDNESSQGSDSEDNAENQSVDSSDEDQEEHGEPQARPYMALLQSLNHSSTPRAKKRKLTHQDHREDGEDLQEMLKIHDDDSKARKTGRSRDSDASSEEAEGAMEEEETQGELDEEEEQDPLDDLEEQDVDGSEDEDELQDPFASHFDHPDELKMPQLVKDIGDKKWAAKRMQMSPFAAAISIPQSMTEYNPSTTLNGLQDLDLKQKLRETATPQRMGDLGQGERTFARLLFDYRDILHCDRNRGNGDQLRKLVCLHALNHVFKTRTRVLKNNAKLAKEGEDTTLELRDQGFTRPKVLFILPTRNSCWKVMKIIQDLCEPDQQENHKRFDETFLDKETKFGQDRPADFQDLFEGNDDDMFRIGVKFTRKTVKYFSAFYSSDILFASPLGLRMAIGSEEDKKKIDYDFLSSIEMVIMDQADALLMQNWEHIEYIFEHLNLQPKEAHGCDFSRVRDWYLNGWGQFFRQNIILSAFGTPELYELQRSYCHNWAGKLRLTPEYPSILQDLGIRTRQTFSRFQSPSVDKDPDARFEYFASAIIPSIVKRAKDASGTLIFIPSYLDFVRVRNYFATSSAVSNITFGAISEYTDVSEASRARSHFYNEKQRVLLYTERAHHFRRYQFRGVRRVIFYGLPDNPIFYKELAGGFLAKSEQEMLIEPGQGQVKVMFSQYDANKLERVAGSRRTVKMLKERGDTFDFL